MVKPVLLLCFVLLSYVCADDGFEPEITVAVPTSNTIETGGIPAQAPFAELVVDIALPGGEEPFIFETNHNAAPTTESNAADSTPPPYIL